MAAFLIAVSGLTPAVAAKGGGTTTTSVLEYSQCQNGSPSQPNATACDRWGNGILNTSNSHYSEDQVTPQRLLLSANAGSTNTVTIRYMTRKGSASAHAYDSLATWNYTQVNADRCQGLKASDCPGGNASIFQMKSDPAPVQPSATGISNVTAAHELPAESRQWVMFGGQITGATVPVHTTDPNDPGSDYAKVTVSFTANASRVELLFGGHLAASTGVRGWGAGLGSSNISGGPYHIILDALNGASVGSRDNQIMSGAILPGSPSFSVVKSASPSTTTPGQPVTYTITVTNNGSADGATTFTDDFDDRLSPSTPTSSPTGGTCQREPAGDTNRRFVCTTTLLAAGGGSQTFTYTVTMPSSFDTGAGTGGCGPGEFPVYNLVMLASGGQDDALVCITAAPNLTVTKSANPSVATPGQLVTYTITISNTGSASGSTTFTDNYDDRLTPSSPTASPAGGSCTNITTGDMRFECTSGTVAAGQSQTWTYTANMPTTFTGDPGGNGCSPSGPQQYPVRNVVVLANGNGDDAVVCVNASPSFTVVKTANPTTASPGQTVTYTIVVTNGGTAAGSTTFTDDFDDRLDPTTPAGCTLNTSGGNKRFDCTTGTIAPNGGTQTFTYTATMPTSFTGSPGGNGCSASGPQQYPVRNVVVLANGSNDDAVVCVNASPNFTVVKTANPTTANPGQTVTYTIVVTNTGNAAGSTTFTDDFDDRLSPTTPAGCTLLTSGGNKRFECTTGTIAPNGGTQTFTYTAAMPTSFTGSPGGNGCSASGPQQYPVRNVVVLANGSNDDAVVCVNASPSFTVVKTANPTTATPGQTVTYTIVVTNGGTAAGSTTFTDDFDDRLSPTTPAGCTLLTSGANKRFECTTGTIAANGGTQTFTYTAAMPTGFTGAPGGNGCNATPGPGQQYPVRNVVVLVNGTSDDAVVCVNAAPDLHVNKTASPSTASPGQTVTYTIVVTNTGTASGSTTFTDDFDDRLSPTTPAGTGQQYPVRNVVVLANGDNDDAVVCVNAAPNLTLVKSVVKTTDESGHEVLTYTLTYTNNGAAEATTATITEDVPAGTTYQSCSNDCSTSGTPISGVSWTVGPIAPNGGTSSVTLTVVVTTHTLCSVSNTAHISTTGFNGGNPVSSNTLVTPVTPSPDPEHANASGSAYGALVTTHGLLNVTTTKLSSSESSQHGVGGPSMDSDSLLTASVPAILTASVMRTTSSSQVTETPPQATSTSTSEVLGLCVLPIATVCTVESSTLRAVARADAFGTGASFSSAGSTIENLKIAGVVTPVDLNQTTTVPLAPLVFGAGSYVAINERSGGTSLSGGAYRADLEVNMIRVHVTGALGVQAVDVTVAHAEAHADFPKLTVCGPQVDLSVSGHAFVASAAVLPPLVMATVGYVGIPASGGSETQNLASASVLNGSLLTTGVATSRTLGVIDATSASAGSRAQVAGVCLLRFAAKPTQCVVMADVAKSVSTSTANSSGATSSDQVSATDKTELVNLVIRTAPDTPLVGVPINPAPNTTITIPGIGFIVLNEQVCDGGSLAATTQPRCQGANHSGLTVRSLHLVLLQNFGPFNPGLEVIVAEAHSDATDN